MSTSILSYLWDNHMHSSFSGDCDTPMEQMVLRAKELGLAGITFTDHLDLDYKAEPGLFDLDFEACQDSVYEMQKKYNDETFSILYGIEVGLQPHLAKTHHDLLEKYSFDYVIGSSHVVEGIDPYYPEYFDQHGILEGYRRYFSSIIDNLDAFHEADSYGHLDYIIRYSGEAGASYGLKDYEDIVDAILEKLIRYDVALEVNTGAFRCGLTQPNPETEIIRRYHDKGGKLITIGADAHKTEHVALAYDKLPEILTSCGFSEYAVYQGRSPIFFPIH